MSDEQHRETGRGSFDTERTSRRERRAHKKRGGMLEFLLILVLSFVLVFGVVRPFIVEAFVIPSESMVPTLEVGDRVLANKFIYRFTEPAQGDVVVFESVEQENQNLIKRVVGLPGDTVEVREDVLLVNGEEQDEPYLNSDVIGPQVPHSPETVPENSYFFMGDNRANSYDSRSYGPVPEENLEGDAFMLFWPPIRLSTL